MIRWRATTGVADQSGNAAAAASVAAVISAWLACVRGAVRGAINLAIVMLLGGLWHGAALTFLAWGAIHGLALGVERLLGLADGRNLGPRGASP